MAWRLWVVVDCIVIMSHLIVRTTLRLVILYTIQFNSLLTVYVNASCSFVCPSAFLKITKWKKSRKSRGILKWKTNNIMISNLYDFVFLQSKFMNSLINRYVGWNWIRIFFVKISIRWKVKLLQTSKYTRSNVIFCIK